MIPLAADVNFHGAVLRGLLFKNPALDVVRLQDVGLGSADDPRVLEWAAAEGRVLVTHDVNTMIGHASNRINAGEKMAGLLLVPQPFAIVRIIEDLHLIAECCAPEELEGRWIYLPLR